ANKVVDEQRPLKLARDLKVEHPKAEAFFLWARTGIAQRAKNYPAPLKCVDAVEAAVNKPFDEGLQIERRLFAELLMSEESAALRHAFFAERATSKIPDIAEDTPTREIKSVGI